MAENRKSQPSGAKPQAPKPSEPLQSKIANTDFLHGAILMRNAVVREEAVTKARIMTISGGLIAFLVVLLALVAARPRETAYFATTAGGRIIPIVGLTHPIASDATVGLFAARALMAANTYDSANYKIMLSRAANKYFTKEGWNQYLIALKKSGNLKFVKDQQVMVSAIPTGAPVAIIPGEVVHGRYQWVFQIPMQITYSSLNQRVPQTAIFTITVVRVNVTQHPSGLAVQAIDFKVAKA